MVTVDETGLHAEGCDCALCETGYRPSPQERAVARRALEARRRAAERIAQGKPAVASPPPYYRTHFFRPTPDHRPYTEEELADLERMRREFKR